MNKSTAKNRKYVGIFYVFVDVDSLDRCLVNSTSKAELRAYSVGHI